ncbi:hypothetical protein CQ12_30375 [Bradyrhizobium jicamae]|uniref:Uncharacterized protein n=1 Tax=Bradyrhizobium jicamae TaxID=280332 RepID=A0A0R3KEB3_9BRAD|nr:hypothetical protein CQ12_30375 [Bradyrhizobium jicamae]
MPLTFFGRRSVDSVVAEYSNAQLGPCLFLGLEFLHERAQIALGAPQLFEVISGRFRALQGGLNTHFLSQHQRSQPCCRIRRPLL